MSSYCPKCKTIDVGKYCTHCGTELAELPRCKCDGKLYPTDKFCSTCGTKVKRR